jgi:hypothetical protein
MIATKRRECGRGYYDTFSFSGRGETEQYSYFEGSRAVPVLPSGTSTFEKSWSFHKVIDVLTQRGPRR